jgi:glycine cleavage system aminomethyltransferase T
VTWSPTLGHPIALALLASGSRRMGETIVAASPLSGDAVPVKVVSPYFFDPQGARQNG